MVITDVDVSVPFEASFLASSRQIMSDVLITHGKFLCP